MLKKPQKNARASLEIAPGLHLYASELQNMAGLPRRTAYRYCQDGTAPRYFKDWLYWRYTGAIMPADQWPGCRFLDDGRLAMNNGFTFAAGALECYATLMAGQTATDRELSRLRALTATLQAENDKLRALVPRAPVVTLESAQKPAKATR